MKEPSMSHTTNETTSPSAPPPLASEEAGKSASDIAATANEKGHEVAAQASSQAKEVIGHAQQEVRSLAEESKAHAYEVASSATDELENQLGERLDAATAFARTTASELQALCEGRPEDAGRSADVLRRAGTRLEDLADRADELGVRGVAGEVSDFARRRPVAFLAGAAVAGVLVGRMARAQHDGNGGGGDETANQQPTGIGRSPAVVGGPGAMPIAPPPAIAPAQPFAPPMVSTAAPRPGEVR
jgi:hypothetical protein